MPRQLVYHFQLQQQRICFTSVDGGLSFSHGVKLMMLKQSPSRNLRAKSLKVKHAFQIFVILAICVWFFYQVKQSYNKKAAMEEERPTQVSENEENEYQILKIGRKHLRPRVDEVAMELEKPDEEVELEDVESNVRENEGEEINVDRDEEIDAGDKEKSEDVEHDQLQDFIDEDDKDT